MVDKYKDKQYNEWTVVKKLDNGKYLCRCSCGTEKEQYIKNIVNGCSKSCGHERKLKGKRFNHWEVLEDLKGGKILCRCDCGTVRELYKKAVVSGQTKSCGCRQFKAPTYKTDDIKDHKFYSLKPIRFIGNATWECQCDCGNLVKVTRRDLLEGRQKSCGCKQGEYLKSTLLSRYGDIASCKVNNPRESWQILALQDAQAMQNVLSKFDHKPTILELAKQLNSNVSTVLLGVHRTHTESLVDLRPTESNYEKEICSLIQDMNPNIRISKHNRKILNGNELDIYLPDKKIAIEFNGNYWHSSIFKDRKYHQNKTLDCAKQGIRLIHIFEYEWINNKEKLINYIRGLINEPDIVIYGRNTNVEPIDSFVANNFLDKYHLQGGTPCKVAYGMYYNKDLIGVITFGKPRFDNDAEYEILRLCYKDNTRVIGGSEKLFSTFLKDYNPKKIISYANISKFTGNVYTRLGFKNPELTTPNYVWVGCNTNKVLTRYQTQKHKLIELGLGTENETEDDIMMREGYFKIYDSGNLKLQYSIEEER